jgi:peroxiredoxin
MPILEDYYRDHQKQNFTVIGIESGQESEDVQYHVDLYKLTFPVWLDLQQTSLRAFQNSSLPNSYVIDKDGQVRLAWTGAISREMLEKHVTPLLED